MKVFSSLALAGALLFGTVPAAQAHFGMVIPSTPTVMEMPEADVNAFGDDEGGMSRWALKQK